MTDEHATHSAAGISYSFVPRPADLANDLVAPAGGALQFLSLTTLDGVNQAGALWTPAGRTPDTPLVLVIHGSGSSFSRLPMAALGNGLSAQGWAVMTSNTRQHDEGACQENFYDLRSDIEAALYTARALGYRRIVLAGHSLGNIQVLFYAATSWARDIEGLVLLGMFADLPWKSRHILTKDEATYGVMIGQAMAAVAAGTPDAVLDEQMSWMEGVRVSATAQHVLTYRCEATASCDGRYWIRRAPYPILMARDQADGIILDFEPYMLLSAATDAGSLVQGIDYVMLPNARPTSRQAHVFTDTLPQLVALVADWLRQKGIVPQQETSP